MLLTTQFVVLLLFIRCSCVHSGVVSGQSLVRHVRDSSDSDEETADDSVIVSQRDEQDSQDETQILESSPHSEDTQILEGTDTQILEGAQQGGDDNQILESRGDGNQNLEGSPHSDDTQNIEGVQHRDSTQILEGYTDTQILEGAQHKDETLEEAGQGEEAQILQNIPDEESKVITTEPSENKPEQIYDGTRQTTRDEEAKSDVESSSNNEPETQSLLGNQDESKVGEERGALQSSGATQYTPIVHDAAENTKDTQTSQDNTEEVTSQADTQVVTQHEGKMVQNGNLVAGSEHQDEPNVVTEQYSSHITDEVHTEEEARHPAAGDYVSALRNLGEAVRSLLPLREHMAVAMECQEGREAAMHNVISEMRGRMVQLEQQLSSSREAERECHMEAQAVRALGLEARLAECKGRLEERQPPHAIVRVEMLKRKFENADEDRESVSLQQLVSLFENEGSKLVKLVSGLESKMTDIHSISKETLKFVESVQESESEDSVQSEELTRLTTMINASEATIASLRLELEKSVDKLKTECRTNLTQAEKECSTSVMAAAAAARAQCAVESARLQGERLGYIVNLHAEHNATLTAAQEACHQELEAYKAESVAQCEATTASQLAAKEAECSDECRAHAVEMRDDATQEQNATLAAVQANCDDALAALQERCDAELRLHLHPDIDVRTQQKKSPEPCRAVQTTVDDPLTSIMCQGYNEPFSNATFIEPEPNEVSVRLGNHLYIVSNQRVDDFATAWRTCRQRGMWLLALETLEEQTELVSRIQLLLAGAEEEHSLWTSAQRDDHSSWFRWQCGNWVTPWAAQRIDSDDACLALAFPRQIGGRIEWRDVNCEQPQQLACEVALGDEE